ncbi:DUF2270 domain-containing protein [Adhaeretor mobilis]|uniref:DUF2270 domain-containing protein n=1 Tax=Adhaeretor mobilis TaxID=1930276 RepID=A0A517MXY8_9BACT|nr:DUF2270 domain-containing protein [Adhaeretor mobilis]QDS99741.1 hypothetical protein HG15A2_30710 [Adhaeretor mobilis]
MDTETTFPQFEDEPLTRAEYIAALAHFYRAEMQRATDWRIRLDTTTNWSIISVMALVSFAMAETERSQVGIVVGMLLVFTFLVIEARRFRFFDVWRSRVRMLEQNFVGPILLRNQQSPVQDWNRKVAADLLRPRYKLTWRQALRVRLVRNYLPMFALLFACWLIKLDSLYANLDHPSVSDFLWQRSNVGDLPMWVSILVVAVLYGYLVGIVALVKRADTPESEYWKEGLREVRDLDT